jgi:hypothetical protein
MGIDAGRHADVGMTQKFLDHDGCGRSTT